MVISHNLKAMNADRNVKVITSGMAKCTEKLSSGYKINRSGDDAAGLSISEKMRFQIRGLDRGSSNIEEGIGYCQVADGALAEMQDMLQRMNELCIQAANGTLSNTDRGYVDTEVQQLKAEIERTCRTTKFNEEYIFRCEDVIAEKPHDVYRLTFSGRPKDLFIYNTSYDADNEYAGVAFRGRRYTWDEINPGMYDKANNEFREGTYAIRADDNTMLTLVCEKGAKLPQVSREFQTSADGRGIYVNDDLIEWSKVVVSGDKYTFSYHGMTVSYTKDPGDSWEDMVLKMSGTVWESTYEVPVANKALDAQFAFGPTYRFMNNTRIEEHLRKGSVTKYILHAEDINHGGKVPEYDANGNIKETPFDGIWIEGTNPDWSPTGVSLYKMDWDAFGFNCGFDKDDWGNQSTDIWVGGIKDDPKPTYPPDCTGPGSVYPNGSVAIIGNQYFATYDPYNPFQFTNTGDQGETVNFIFSVINEIGKEDAIQALDGVAISYVITPYNSPRLERQGGHSNVTSASASNTNGTSHLLTLQEEFSLGRDYENGQDRYELKGPANLNYNNGAFSVSYQNNGYTKTFSMDSGEVNSLVSRLADTLTQNIILGRSRSVSINLDLDNLRLSYGYDTSGFQANIQAKENKTGGAYVRLANGTYERYSPYNASHQKLTRYDVTVTGANGQSVEDYFKNTVLPDLAAATKVSLWTDDYPRGVLGADENPNSAMVTRWQTPFQHEHVITLTEEEEKPEYLRIQCSSNTIDQIYIQKQKLSVYRMGLSNVGTLSELQATGCIDMVGSAISMVSSIRSLFGAEQNRLEHAYTANRNTHENTQRAETEIRDTDMADEMIRFSNANILEKSGISMLAQANQSNQGVLTLLK